MDAVAEAAGVSKATIYKWWPSKGSLALDVLLRGAAEGVTVHDTGDIAADLDAQMRQLIAYFRDTPAGRAIADLIAEAQRDAEIGEAFRRQWLAPRRAAAWTRLEVAQRRGEIRADLDLDLVMDMLYGPIYYRLMSGHAPLDDELAIRAVDTALRGLR